MNISREFIVWLLQNGREDMTIACTMLAEIMMERKRHTERDLEGNIDNLVLNWMWNVKQMDLQYLHLGVGLIHLEDKWYHS